jgi:hypothetical protein
MMKATDVISTGRSRTRHASRMAWKWLSPSFSRCLANSTIRMAFLHASAASTRKLTCVKTLLSPPVSHTPASAESSVIGTMRITLSGSVQLSYCAASTP